MSVQDGRKNLTGRPATSAVDILSWLHALESDGAVAGMPGHHYEGAAALPPQKLVNVVAAGTSTVNFNLPATGALGSPGAVGSAYSHTSALRRASRISVTVTARL